MVNNIPHLSGPAGQILPDRVSSNNPTMSMSAGGGSSFETEDRTGTIFERLKHEERLAYAPGRFLDLDIKRLSASAPVSAISSRKASVHSSSTNGVGDELESCPPAGEQIAGVHQSNGIEENNYTSDPHEDGKPSTVVGPTTSTATTAAVTSTSVHTMFSTSTAGGYTTSFHSEPPELSRTNLNALLPPSPFLRQSLIHKKCSSTMYCPGLYHDRCSIGSTTETWFVFEKNDSGPTVFQKVVCVGGSGFRSLSDGMRCCSSFESIAV